MRIDGSETNRNPGAAASRVDGDLGRRGGAACGDGGEMWDEETASMDSGELYGGDEERESDGGDGAVEIRRKSKPRWAERGSGGGGGGGGLPGHSEHVLRRGGPGDHDEPGPAAGPGRDELVSALWGRRILRRAVDSARWKRRSPMWVGSGRLVALRPGPGRMSAPGRPSSLPNRRAGLARTARQLTPALRVGCPAATDVKISENGPSGRP